jgi:heavy metal efflux system protein
MLVLTRPSVLPAPLTMRAATIGVVTLLALLVGYTTPAKLSGTASRAVSRPPLVEVITQSGGQAADDIERAITVPIETTMAWLPRVTAIRAVSLSGLSDVRVSFSDGLAYADAERSVMSRLSQLSPLLGGVSPQISPRSSIGDVYRYRIVGSPGYSLTDLKTIQGWILERRFKATPGVIGVSSWAGRTKTYEVTIDFDRLSAHGCTLPQVLQALDNGGTNVGGQTVNFSPRSAIIRGSGLFASTEQIQDVVVGPASGVPVRIKDVATARVDDEPPLGVAGSDNEYGDVQGIVLMRRDVEDAPTIGYIGATVDNINSSGILPPGVHVERF